MTEHSDLRRIRPVVLLRDRASERGRDAEQRKELGGHGLPVEERRFADARERVARRPPRRRRLERPARSLPVEPVGGRHRVRVRSPARRASCLVEGQELLAVRDTAAAAAATDRQRRRWRYCRRCRVRASGSPLAAKPGCAHSPRAAWRTSRASCVEAARRPDVVAAFLEPRSRRRNAGAPRRAASSGVSPACAHSRASSESRWNAISRSMSRSRALHLKSAITRRTNRGGTRHVRLRVRSRAARA